MSCWPGKMINGVFLGVLSLYALTEGSCVAPNTTEEVGMEEIADRTVSPPGNERSKDHR